MGMDELIEAVQSLRADDAFRARFNLPQWRNFAAYLTPYQLRAGDLLIKRASATGLPTSSAWAVCRSTSRARRPVPSGWP